MAVTECGRHFAADVRRVHARRDSMACLRHIAWRDANHHRQLCDLTAISIGGGNETPLGIVTVSQLKQRAKKEKRLTISREPFEFW